MKKISFTIDKEIQAVLSNLPKEENRSQYLRNAIKFYLKHESVLKDIQETLKNMDRKIQRLEGQLKGNSTEDKEVIQKKVENSSFDCNALIDSIMSMKKA